MLQIIRDNYVTVIAVIIIAALVILALRKIIKDKKTGVGSCGYKCTECPKADACSLSDGNNND